MVGKQLVSVSGKQVDERRISKFAESLKGALIRPGDGEYESARKVWNKSIDKRPALIARCTDAGDVVAAVNFARDNDLIVAVRGGGHSFPGKSTCDGGIVIDLSTMKNIRVDPQVRRAYAQPGLTLGEFDRATQACGLATPLGVAPPTGIAGLTLGGGIGYLMGKFGLACDNVRAVEIVTADGEKRRADANENADLLWAVRGGGGNFGVVTQFEYELHPVGPLVGGSVAYPRANTRTVLQSVRELAPATSDELTLQAGVLPFREGPDFGIALCHAGDPAAAEREVALLRTIAKPLADRVKLTDYVDIQSMQDVPPIDLSSYAKSDFLRELSDDAIEVLAQSAESAPLPTCFFVVEYIHGVAARVPATATAFAAREAGFNILLLAAWENASDAERCTRWVRDLWDAIHRLGRGTGYVNYLADEADERVRAAYGPNYARLAAIKARYDPANLFRLNQNVKPAT
jgi:FAD/FMN-containing dehydrogenase